MNGKNKKVIRQELLVGKRAITDSAVMNNIKISPEPRYSSGSA